MKLLEMSFKTLDVYGKSADCLKDITKIFMFVLADFKYSDIRDAFQVYLKTERVMPKPADIIELIEKKKSEGKKPLTDRERYDILKESEQQGRYLTHTDKMFIEKFESSFMIRDEKKGDEFVFDISAFKFMNKGD